MSSELNSHPPWLSEKRVIIAGAGIAGLSFARALHKYWPSSYPLPQVVMYERGTKQGNNREGYSISIRSDNASGGMQALQHLGILDSIIPLSHTGLEAKGAMNFWNKDWKPLLTMHSPNPPPDDLPASSMRIARSVLRRALIANLPPEVEVHWELACKSANELPDKRFGVLLSDGSTDTCDLLIAADGANSSIRSCLLPNDQLSFAGAVSISASSHFPEGIPKPIDENWGLVVGGGGTGLFVSPINKNKALWSLSYMAQNQRDRIHGDDAIKLKDEILNEVLERGKAFREPFRQFVNATDASTLMIFNAMDKQPIKQSKINGASVIFIGDSNHAVSPFAGNGANMALMDGIDLAMELCSASHLNQAISAFEKKTTPRSKKSVGQSHVAISMAHATGWKLFFWTVVLKVVGLFFRA